jgi:hypothetical protein
MRRLKMKRVKKAKKTFQLKVYKNNASIKFLKPAEPENAPACEPKKTLFFRPGIELALRLLRAA